MPVIRYIPVDPFDLVIQGERLRSAAFFSAVPATAGLRSGLMDAVPLSWSFLVADDDEEDTGMMPDGLLPNPRLMSQETCSLIANNATISTPCGALICVQIGQHIMDTFVESTSRWVLSGVTKDSSGAALGSCRVVVLETGRIGIGQLPVVAETISDGSGNYSVPVASNTAHWEIAYKAGSPDVAGATVNNVTPTQV